MDHGRRTPFFEKHRRLNGKMVDYHGWLLPVEFAGIVQEVLATRTAAALFDVSHMGEILVEGPGAWRFLQEMLTNDLTAAGETKIIYSPMCYAHGGTVDDLLVYCLGEDRFLLVVNAANTAKDFDWLAGHARDDLTLTDVSAEYAQLALQGPRSAVILAELSNFPVEKLAYYRFQAGVQVAGADCLVSRTGYTGEDGFELYVHPDSAAVLYDALWEAGQKDGRGLVPAGLGARDLLRLEASLPLYGHELSEEISPLEAGLARFVALDKKPAFIGQDALAGRRQAGLSQKLAGLVMLERGIPREGYPVETGGAEIGRISSGSYSPTLEKPLAMAFLRPEKTRLGDQVDVVIRRKRYRAEVVKIPFYRRRSNEVEG